MFSTVIKANSLVLLCAFAGIFIIKAQLKMDNYFLASNAVVYTVSGGLVMNLASLLKWRKTCLLHWISRNETILWLIHRNPKDNCRLLFVRSSERIVVYPFFCLDGSADTTGLWSSAQTMRGEGVPLLSLSSHKERAFLCHFMIHQIKSPSQGHHQTEIFLNSHTLDDRHFLFFYELSIFCSICIEAGTRRWVSLK